MSINNTKHTDGNNDLTVNSNMLIALSNAQNELKDFEKESLSQNRIDIENVGLGRFNPIAKFSINSITVVVSFSFNTCEYRVVIQSTMPLIGIASNSCRDIGDLKKFGGLTFFIKGKMDLCFSRTVYSERQEEIELEDFFLFKCLKSGIIGVELPHSEAILEELNDVIDLNKRRLTFKKRAKKLWRN